MPPKETRQNLYPVLRTGGKANDDGRFVVVWGSDEQDGDNYGIYAQVGVIPEPAALTLLAVDACLPLLRRRRR